MSAKQTAPFLGPRLRELREKRGLTGGESAEAIGVTGNHLYCVERGEKLLSIDAVRRAAEFYGVEFHWLLEGPSGPTPKPRKRRKRS